MSCSCFVVMFLVQFCIILVRNGMFYEKHKSSYLVTFFYYVINTVYIYSWKNLIKFWPVLVMLYVKSVFFIARVVQLDNIMNPPGGCMYFPNCAWSDCPKHFWVPPWCPWWEGMIACNRIYETIQYFLLIFFKKKKLWHLTNLCPIQLNWLGPH